MKKDLAKIRKNSNILMQAENPPERDVLFCEEVEVSSQQDFRLINSSKPRLLNLILLNLIERWPMGAAIVRPPNTENSENNITAT